MALRVLGLCGSLRPKSVTALMVKLALDGAKSVGSEVEFYDLAEAALPFCDGRSDIDSYPESVQYLRKLIREADGIIIGTPEYHNSLTGSLKNAIDLCDTSDFEHKMVGLLGTAGGSMGAINSINHLRVIMRGVGAWVIPHQVSVTVNAQTFSGPDQLADPKLLARIEKLGIDVGKYSKLFADGRVEFAAAETL